MTLDKLEIVKSKAGGKSGYRVKNTKTGTYYSKEALPLKVAKKQRTAILLSELQKQGRIPLKNMMEGGIVPNPYNMKPVEGDKKDYGDLVPAILETGEVVIPVEHSQKIIEFLKKNNIKLPNM